ncbi:unnamed protein product [Dibothriocephalus latus]|uniref:Uncharacterized protein n=1 Tax=Dibothriocephalus latus TaxID=60516 RepID=A0A3P7ND45_DIBLA|nr:unnamed protein product [Dibothriocephalus latus]
MDSPEQRCIVLYEDPLVHYDPCLLDDPLMPKLTNRRVFSFLGYVLPTWRGGHGEVIGLEVRKGNCE